MEPHNAAAFLLFCINVDTEGALNLRGQSVYAFWVFHFHPKVVLTATFSLKSRPTFPLVKQMEPDCSQRGETVQFLHLVKEQLQWFLMKEKKIVLHRPV